MISNIRRILAMVDDDATFDGIYSFIENSLDVNNDGKYILTPEDMKLFDHFNRRVVDSVVSLGGESEDDFAMSAMLYYFITQNSGKIVVC